MHFARSGRWLSEGSEAVEWLRWCWNLSWGRWDFGGLGDMWAEVVACRVVRLGSLLIFAYLYGVRQTSFGFGQYVRFS